MPRVSTKDPSDSPKRAPRRQVVRKTPSARVRSSAVVTKEIDKRDSGFSPTRKAPTSIKAEKTSFRISGKKVIISSVFVAVLTATIWIGTSDDGQINVSSKIEQRNTQIANGEITAENSSGVNGSQVVPVQNAPTIPNGGLKGRGVGTPPVNSQQASVPASDVSASTTEATSTEAVNEESLVNEQENTESAPSENTEAKTESGESVTDNQTQN